VTIHRNNKTMNVMMKAALPSLLGMLLSGCVTVSMPSEIEAARKAAETAKEQAAAKDLIQAARGATATGKDKPVITHSYIGKDNQTVADIKQSCVVEATQKLAQSVGTDVRSVVLENEVVTAKGKVVANCKLALQE
jgi:predicted extracellular nuclease